MIVDKILLADDDSEDRTMIQDTLKLLGAEDVLWTAENGEEVLSLLNQKLIFSQFPCLIILDLNMPKMNGTQTLGKLKNDQRFKDIPVIIYSTSVNPLEKEKCLLLGAHSFMTKPHSFKESINTARIFLEFSKLKTFV